MQHSKLIGINILKWTSAQDNHVPSNSIMKEVLYADLVGRKNSYFGLNSLLLDLFNENEVGYCQCLMD